MDDYKVDFGGPDTTNGYIAEKTGQNRPIAYFDPSRPLFHVKLRDPPVGTYSIKTGGFYVINAWWSDTERAKWHAYQHIKIPRDLNAEETMWLKKHYGNEYRFLRDYGYDIHDDEEREDGRALLRAFVQEHKEQSTA